MLEFVDLFCGAGGLTRGLMDSGLIHRGGVDICGSALETYARNFGPSQAIQADISANLASSLRRRIRARRRFVVSGAPPCQMFSRIRRAAPQIDGHVIFRYLELLDALRADYLVFENVPRLLKFDDVWPLVVSRLEGMGYQLWWSHVPVTAFGVAQKRRRLVVIGSRVPFSEPTVPPVPVDPPTVRDAIEDLGTTPLGTRANHNASHLSAINLARIRAIGADGGQTRRSGEWFSDSYARMSWDEPAPTITTRCVSFSNGRFGHPVQDRAITPREAARLQGFRDDFVFDERITVAARQVGNAVPPPVGAWLGHQILRIDAGRRRARRRRSA